MTTNHILKLDPAVVHRIAAGEVIQRPSGAVKELLENSVDAGATLIQITVIDGGLKLIQIIDNGHGIMKDDLPLVCERFATSKLVKFEDLQEMKTFGFRGEALASISHVARLSLTSKTKDSPCAYKVDYLNGQMTGEPQVLAGNQGTIIAISDLFYNIPTRLKGMEGTASEEYSSILKVVQRYAIQLAGKVGFSCRKGGSSAKKQVDLQTSSAPSTTGMDVIGQVFGPQISKMTISFGPIEIASLPSVVLRGHLSMPTYHQKGATFILFINGRLVECTGLKRTVAAVYAEILPKGTHPFVHLSLEMAPHLVDVNVHPTKNEVFFLNEVEVLEFVDRSIREALKAGPMPLAMAQSSQSQSQEEEGSQSQLKISVNDGARKMVAERPKATVPSLSSFRPPSYPHQQVHTDRKVRTLDSFAYIAQKRSKAESSPLISITPTVTASKIEHTHLSNETTPKRRDGIAQQPISPQVIAVENVQRKEAEENYSEFSSVVELKNRITSSVHQHLTEVIKECVIVGVFDSRRTFIQYQTQLLTIEHLRFASEMLYQRLLMGFGYHDILKINSVNVERLLAKFYSEAEAIQANTALQSYWEMLLEYFGLHISEDGLLMGIPRLLEGLEFPDIGANEDDARNLAELLHSLAFKVDYTSSETDCFDAVMRLIALYFVYLIGRQPSLSEYIQHFLFPALKGSDMGRFGSTIEFDQELVSNGAIISLTSTHDLYKVFERC